ncbi:hypothetical protein GCM10010331_66190 [Streptomyces xanthochromogenes]|nr:hypothetical protein GCM10010331_66190 [Streptomyces xanthochromogenes]
MPRGPGGGLGELLPYGLDGVGQFDPVERVGCVRVAVGHGAVPSLASILAPGRGVGTGVGGGWWCGAGEGATLSGGVGGVVRGDRRIASGSGAVQYAPAVGAGLIGGQGEDGRAVPTRSEPGEGRRALVPKGKDRGHGPGTRGGDKAHRVPGVYYAA